MTSQDPSGSAPSSASWVPGRLYVGEHIITTDPLATWWPQFDQDITNWKMSRRYVDARDVSPETFTHHPANSLGPQFPRLTAMLEATPVFALGTAEQGSLRAPTGARIYAIGFARNADDYLSIDITGPGMQRHLSGPFVVFDEIEHGGDREATIERFAAHLSDGRLHQRSIDLAEMWSRLVDGPSLFAFFDDEERQQYLRVLESGLEEAMSRAEAQREHDEAILVMLQEAERSNAREVDLPLVGRAHHQHAPPVQWEGKLESEATYGELVIDIDGESTMTLPETRQWVLERNVVAFEPESARAWRAKASERQQRWSTRRPEQLSNVRRRQRIGLVLLALVLCIVGVLLAYQFSKGSGGSPCLEGDDCRSGYCRQSATHLGVCLTRCRRSPCNDGRPCLYDPEFGHFFCEPDVR